MKLLLLGFALAFTLTLQSRASAQTYPAKPITIVVPFSAGGPTDTLARILGERMRKSLGQPILVDNTTGAGGSIGVAKVVRAPPDGYMVSIGHWGTHVVNGAYYTLPYSDQRASELQNALDGAAQGGTATMTQGDDVGGESYDGEPPVSGDENKTAERPVVEVE